MANEITVNASLSIVDSTSQIKALQSGDVLATITTHQQELLKMSIATTATAIPVSSLTSPGWAIFINRDATNYIDLYTDNGANKKLFARLPAGGLPCLLFLGTDAKAPYALANTAACLMEFLILDT